MAISSAQDALVQPDLCYVMAQARQQEAAMPCDAFFKTKTKEPNPWRILDQVSGLPEFV